MAAPNIERRLIQFYLILGDMLGLYGAFLIVQMIRFGSWDVSYYAISFLEGGRFLKVFFLIGMCQYVFDLYEPRHWRSTIFSPLKILFSSFTAALLMFAYFYFVATSTTGVYGRGVLLGSLGLFTLFSLVLRYVVDRGNKAKVSNHEWLFVGSAASEARLKKDWARLKFPGRLHVVVLGGMTADAFKVLLRRGWHTVIVEGTLPEEFTKILMQERLGGVLVLSLQSFYEFYCGKLPIYTLNDSWFALSEGFSILHSQVSMRLKRMTDILISLLMMVLLAPVFVLLYVLIRLESRGPALYSQVRMGAGGKQFVMWKFRSMRKDAEAGVGAQWAQKNDMRVTRLGRLMRKVRLDEIPQLWNILHGEMSFIGPRPERPEFTDDLSKKIPFFEYRLLVKPGLTGWAQVMYPYGASEEDALEKLQYDLFYIKNYSFPLDLEIIFKTISVVLFGAGR